MLVLEIKCCFAETIQSCLVNLSYCGCRLSGVEGVGLNVFVGCRFEVIMLFCGYHLLNRCIN